MFVHLCPHLGFHLKCSGKGPIKSWHDPQTLQVAHKNQEIPITKNKVKDFTIARQLGLKNLSVIKLGFLIDWGPQREIFIWTRANTSRHDSRGSHTSWKSIHKFKIASKDSLNAHLKIRVSPIKFHLEHKGQNWNFFKYQVSWANIQGNMAHRGIWSRINQEIKITCKRSKVGKLENFF